MKKILALILLSFSLQSQTLIKLKQLENATAGSVITTTGTGTPTWTNTLPYSILTGTPTLIGAYEPKLNGTGFVKSTGTVTSYDNTSYIPTSSVSAFQPTVSGGYVPYVGANSFTTTNNITANSFITNTLNFNYVTGTTLGGLSKVSGDGITFTNNNTGDFGWTVRNGTYKLQTYCDTTSGNENAQLGVNKGAFNLYSSGGVNLILASNGNISAGGNFTPRSFLELKQGTNTWSPLRFISGSLVTNTTNILAGNIEFLTDIPYITISTGLVRKEFTLNDQSLTSGRIPFITTNGRLTDNSLFTYNTTNGLSVGALTYTDTGILAAFQSSTNGYNQVIIANTSTATNASANYIVSNNAGTASTNYGEFGMNSSTFTGTPIFNQPNAVYLTATTGSLNIGTTTAHPINIAANNGSIAAITVNTLNAVNIPTLTATTLSTSGASTLTGIVNTSTINGNTSLLVTANGTNEMNISTTGVRIGNGTIANSTLDVSGTMSVSSTSTLNSLVTNTSSTLNGQTSLASYSASGTGTNNALIANTTLSVGTTCTLTGSVETKTINNSGGSLVLNAATGNLVAIKVNNNNIIQATSGGALLTGTLSVSSTSTLTGLTNTGAMTTSTTFSCGTNLQASGTMSITGASTLTGAVRASSNLSVTGTFSAGTTATVTGNFLGAAQIATSSKTAGIGYAVGSGSTVTQATSRTTGVTINSATGQITLVSAAGSAAYQSFTVTNSAVAVGDVIIVNQQTGTDLYECHVTAIATGSFRITYATTGGTTVETPILNFAVIKGQSN